MPDDVIATSLDDTEGQQIQIELLLSDSQFRVRTHAGPRFDLAAGTYVVEGNRVTFTGGSGTQGDAALVAT